MAKTVGFLTVALAISSAIYMAPALPALLLALVWTVDLVVNRRRPGPLVGLLVLLYAYCLVSLLWTTAHVDAFFVRWQIRGLIGFLPLFVWLTPPLRSSARMAQTAVLAFVGAAGLVSLIGVVQYSLGYVQRVNNDFASSFYAVRHIVGQDWFMGFFRSHSAAGGYFCLATLASLALLLFWQSPRWITIANALAGCLILWAFIFAKSRLFIIAGALSAGMLLAIYLVQSRRVHALRPALLKAAAIVAVSLLIVSTNPGAMQRMALWRQTSAAMNAPVDEDPDMAGEEADPAPAGRSLNDRLAARTVGDRKQIWKASLSILADSPVFGHGLGSFPVELARRWEIDRKFYSRPEMLHAHNSLLNFAVELGLIGAGLFVVLGVCLARVLIRGAAGSPPGSFEFAMTLGALAMLLSQIIGSLADHNLWSPTIMLPLTALVGIAACPMSNRDAADTAQEPVPQLAGRD